MKETSPPQGEQEPWSVREAFRPVQSRENARIFCPKPESGAPGPGPPQAAPGAYPNPPALAAAVPSPNTLPPVEPRGLVKAGAEPNAGTPPNPGDPPKVGGLPNTGAAPKPPEQNRGKQTEMGERKRETGEKTLSSEKPNGK